MLGREGFICSHLKRGFEGSPASHRTAGKGGREVNLKIYDAICFCVTLITLISLIVIIIACIGMELQVRPKQRKVLLYQQEVIQRQQEILQRLEKMGEK
jgi:hypothetical protein